MAKKIFQKGDRVRVSWTTDMDFAHVGQVGVVIEDCPITPWVLFDESTGFPMHSLSIKEAKIGHCDCLTHAQLEIVTD